MSRQSFFALHALLHPHIGKKQTHLRPTISFELRLAIFIYNVSHGDVYNSISELFAIAKSTVSTIISNVSRAIVHHLSTKYIPFSTMDEAMRSMEYWSSIQEKL